MKIIRIQVLLVLSLLLGAAMSLNIKAARKSSPSKYLKSVYFHQGFEGGDDDGAPIEILQMEEMGIDFEFKKAYEKNSQLSVECRIYKYSGKLKKSTILKKSSETRYLDYWFKISKKDKCVYYCKVRVLRDGTPVTRWSKPIYCWCIRAKAFKVNLKSSKKCTIKFPKLKGVKSYKYQVRDGFKTFKKGKTKPGKTIKVKSLKLRWEDNQSEFWIYIDPVYKKKSDPLSADAQRIDRWVQIEKKNKKLFWVVK